MTFHLISHPFFIDMVKNLYNGYEPPCPNTLFTEKINEVITDVGPEKFSAVVSDHATTCTSVKRIIADTHKHIISIRYIAHHINLITTDICKTPFAKEVISKFKGGNLKSYVKMRWSIAWDCISSILCLKNQLKNLLNECSEIV
ncbi:hypothetical protein RclHR1_21720001 [Rhizophagus clarus]|uniref:DUF659 domain-containing protein n=1 Tax=Rhizophagus clarus TaxID=94130 RepID=A0A2Z6QTT6_9GLOM|nr:hypothetical protein RclHR1_21720001 [Rhizophagus clarus]